MKSPKLTAEIIQPLIESDTEPDRAAQTLDGYGCQQRTVNLMVAYASVLSSKSKVQLDSHTDSTVIEDNC